MRAATATPRDGDPLWYKDAVIYQLHVKAFYDADGDGTGDFHGLIEKLDYLVHLGVSALWLLPFYPSPLRDDGYDISDYVGVHPSYGTMRDVRAFVRAAHERGLRVITELIVNHTSDQHAWFQRARRAKPGSAWRNFYVWSDTDSKYAGTRIIFTDTESSNWTWDPVAKEYYWHRFFSHQPDLNFDSPRVRKAIADVMRHWFDLGVDGMRLDAVPYLCEREGTNNENLPETHAVIKELRAIVDAEYPGRFLLAEANQWPEDVRPYFGDGDECHMAFHFPLMPRMFMAIAQEDRYPIYDIMRQTPPIPDNAQWAIFLRNHDELTLEMVSESERSLLYSVYAAEERARLNVGIRRRLAPLMDNDRRKIELLVSLLLSMPGTPVIYYGDEIGMGDNIYLGDRDGVRTPMQWSPDRNGGFSRADAQRLYLPIVQDPLYGFNSVNVESQMRSPSSQLNWLRRMIAVRQAHRVFGRGTLSFLYPDNRRVIAYTREIENEAVLCVANLAHTSQPVRLDLSRFLGRTPIEMLDWSTFPAIVDDRYVFTLPGHAFFWFLLSDRVAEPATTPTALQPEFVTLVIPHGWRDLLGGASRVALEEEILPKFLVTQPWYVNGAVRRATRARITEAIPLGAGIDPPVLALVEADADGKSGARYNLPLALSFDDATRAPSVARLAFARARRGPRGALIYDAVADDRLWLRLTDSLRSAERVAGDAGTLVFEPTWSLDGVPLDQSAGVRRLQEARNLHDDAVAIANGIALKLYRQIEPGVHPEVELGKFLHEAAFEHAPPLLGAIEYHANDGRRYALGVAHRFVESQGDAWRVTLNFLERMLDRSRTIGTPSSESGVRDVDDTALYGRPAFALGQTLAELHCTLAGGEGPDFAPEAFGAKDVEELAWAVRQRVDEAFETLSRTLRSLPEPLQHEASALLARRDQLVDRIAELAAVRHRGRKQRIHGRFHLGNVLVTERGVLIVGFDGDRRRPFAARRDKASPLEDLAGVLQSFDYAETATLTGLTADRTEDLSQFAPDLALWKRRATAAFLAGYHRSNDAPIDRELLALFRLDRTLYAIVYEIANRPSWLTIPIRSIASVLDGRDA